LAKVNPQTDAAPADFSEVAHEFKVAPDVHTSSMIRIRLPDMSWLTHLNAFSIFFLRWSTLSDLA
jgi:hypothetical protein